MNENTELIECENHQLSPWSVVCSHLLEGSSRQWEPLPSSSLTVEFDWLCPQCLEKYNSCDENDEPPKELLKQFHAVCIHCVRKVRKIYDPSFK